MEKQTEEVKTEPQTPNGLETHAELTKEHVVQLQVKKKVTLDKTTAAWLMAHTQIDINSSITLKVASQVFATLRDALKEKNNNIDKIIETCNRCPCASHDAMKKAAEMLKNHMVGDA